jgi:hypothetical protein
MLDTLSFKEAIEAIAACGSDAAVWQRFSWVYVQGDQPLLESRFYLALSEDDETFDDKVDMAAEQGLCTLLEAADFADVLSMQKRQQPLSSLEEYALAMAHYAEQDAFLEVNPDYAPAAVVPPGLARDLYPEYDVHLAQCPPQLVGAAARVAAKVLQVDIATALRGCRALPLCLGERVGANRRGQIEEGFLPTGVPVQCTTYRSFAWQLA